MKSKDIIKEASVMDYDPPKNWNDPAAIKAREREQGLAPDPFSQMFTPGVSSVQDAGDVAQGDLSAAPYMALGMVPLVGGPLRKLAKKVFGGGERTASKAAFSKEQQRLANLSPAERQAEKDLASSLLQLPSKPIKPKSSEQPIPKRDASELTAQQRNYKELDRPAVQRKAEADKAAKDAAAVDKSSQPRYTMDPKTGKPVPANVQAQLQQKLQGKGFKEPEPGTVSNFKPRGVNKKAEQPAVQPATSKSTDQPAVQTPTANKTLDGKEIRPGFEFNNKTGKWEPSKTSDNVLPSARNTPIKPEKSDTKAALASTGLHAALLYALANMDSDEKKSGAEQSKSAQQGDADKPLTVNLIDPGSQTASDAAATTSPSTAATTSADTSAPSSNAITATVDDGGEKSLPPIVVTAKPEKNPKKEQPVVKSEPTKKAEEPKADQVMTTTEPSSWETPTDKDPESAEADKVDDKETTQTTPAVAKPAEKPESEDDIFKRLLKLFDRPSEEPKPEPKAEPKAEPKPEPKQEPKVEKGEPKPEPTTEPKDGKGKADAEKGDSDKKGDEKEAYPKFDKSEKNELPRDTEKKGSDTVTRKTDSAVDIGPATTGRDNAINWAPPPEERKYEPDDRATRLRDQLRQRSKRGASDADLENIPRMEPVRESLDYILGLSNITKKEIVESTMNLDMRQMLQLMTEASKMADIKGKKHTGKYGKEYDTDEEGDDKTKAKAEPAEKKGRGRPKKDSNVEAGKYKGADDAAKHVIGGSAPKGKSKLPSKKHTLKDWFESTEEAIVEGAKVDRMVGHIAKSERGLGKSKKEAENIAWATANKRGYLDNKNKKKVKEGEKFTSNGKRVSKDQYDTLMKAAGKQPSPEKVKEELKGGQKNLDKNSNGKLDSEDFKMLRSGKKKVKEGVNFAEMMKETQMTIEEMLEGLQQEIAEFKATGSMGEKLRDALDIHRHSNKDKLMGEVSMMSQPVVEQPVEESPFTYAAKQAKASGEDSFKLGGETFPVTESEGVEESFPAYAKGNEKFGKDGMAKLRNASQEGASEEKMAQIRDEHNKYKMKEDGPGSAQLYGDGDDDFDPVNSLKKLANKGIDKWNAYEQGKKDRWDSALGVKSGYIPGTLPRFDTKPDFPLDFPEKTKPEDKVTVGPLTRDSDQGARGKFQSMPKVVAPDLGATANSTKSQPKPKSDITDREKPYRDSNTGKMVVPPKGLSISEPYGKEAMKKSVKESLEFNLWDSQLEKMLSESLTVTTTQGDNGQDDSVSITASGEKATEIMALLRNAGMDSMSPEVSPEVSVAEPEQMLSAYGVPMSNDSVESSSGNDDIMALMQKLSGLTMGDMDDSAEVHVIDTGMGPDHDEEESDSEHDEEDSADYKDEEGNEGEEEDKSEEDSDEEDSDDEEEKVDEGYGQADEGNAFTNKLAHTQKGDEFELDGKKYKDTSSLEEGEDMCQECGMSESECSHNRMDEADSPFQNENLESARPIEEELANGADDTTMQDIKFLIKTLAGGLNKEKRDQTTLPHTAVKVTESKQMINEWKKLSGIK
jgi:hypothetical protein